MARDGSVSTLLAGLPGRFCRPDILPNGYLALCVWIDDASTQSRELLLVDLGLAPPPLRPPAPRPGSPEPGTLAGDLGSLLARQPDATADVTLLVGGRAFSGHRAILCARSLYFRRLLEGGFAEGGPTGQRLSLPDADADIFALLLRFLYTGQAGEVPAAQLQALAELADRLGVEELCRQAQVGFGGPLLCCVPVPVLTFGAPIPCRPRSWRAWTRRAWWARCCGPSSAVRLLPGCFAASRPGADVPPQPRPRMHKHSNQHGLPACILSLRTCPAAPLFETPGSAAAAASRACLAGP